MAMYTFEGNVRGVFSEITKFGRGFSGQTGAGDGVIEELFECVFALIAQNIYIDFLSLLFL